MKKLLLILVSVLLLFGFGTSVSADLGLDMDDPKIQEAIDLIDQTNAKIKIEIKKGQEKAEELKERYLSDVRKLEEKGLVPLIIEKEEILRILESETKGSEKYKKAEEELFVINNEIQNEQSRINTELSIVEKELDETLKILLISTSDEPVTPSIDSLRDQIKGSLLQARYEDLTLKYFRNLLRIVDNVSEKTYKLSQRTIQKVAEVGIQAECYWELVTFADLEAWIDPIYVVGRN